MSDFLLELRCEEIPARMQAGARAELEKLFRREMDAAGVTAGAITVWSTPRRLALIARDLPQATEAVSTEEKGPPVGAPDQAVDGFCRKNGVERGDLEVRDVKGRETYFAVKNVPGRATADVLAEAIPAIVRDFAWPKSMRWGAASLSTESQRWVRPLSGIVAILGEDLVACEVAGIASGYATKGHRFHCPGEITIGSADDYAEKLRACHVIVDHEERQDIIREQAAKMAADAGLTLVADEGLVIENAGLTEWPVPLLGRFDEGFLDVPPEVIQLTARVNQKYFVCEDSAGKLANAFVCTANISAENGGAAIVDGNRKVLAARLSDARFFWELDQKTPLKKFSDKLGEIVFHERLGRLSNKQNRTSKFAKLLTEFGLIEGANPELAERATHLAKVDLVSEMVGEFPELQGIMGGYYAIIHDEGEHVANAIRDHYKPAGPADEVPTAPITVAASLADKIDSIYGFFSIGELPTGSKDPYALRRQTLAVIALLLRNQLRIPISTAMEAMGLIYQEEYIEWMKEWVPGLEEKYDIYRSQPIESFQQSFETLIAIDQAARDEFFGSLPETTEEPDDPYIRVEQERRVGAMHRAFAGWNPVFYEWGDVIAPIPTIMDFFADRLKVQQREAGVRHDLIDAVFAIGGEDDLVRLLARVHALQAFVQTEDGTNLLAGYKRAANILKKEDWGSAEPQHTGDEDPLENVDDPDMREIYAAQANTLSYTREPAEEDLAKRLEFMEGAVRGALAEEDFDFAMRLLASLRAPIDAFFEEVTVNDDDPAKRSARLDLLARFRVAVHNVADFSKIEG